MPRFACAILMCATLIFQLSCQLLPGGQGQPLLSRDIHILGRLRDESQFPYAASDQRQHEIAAGQERVRAGMTGDEVLAVMGTPDIAETIAGSLGSVRGFSWMYCIRRRSLHAYDENDRFVKVVFERDGRVRDVDRKLE